MRKEVSFFNDTSTSYRAEYTRETPDGYSFRVRRDKMLSLMQNGDGKHALDLASGPGVMIAGLRKEGWQVTCVDAAPEMITLAKEEAKGDPLVSAEVGDAYQLRFSDGAFDAVSAMGLIEYLENEEDFMRETARITKPQGICIITFPNVLSPWRLFNRVLMFFRFLARPIKKLLGIPFHPVTHREYSLRRAQELLKQQGFEPYAVMYDNFRLVPYPIDRLLPRFTVWQSTLTEHLDRSPLKFIGTGFIVAARKKPLV